jgi:hypothetical protein
MGMNGSLPSASSMNADSSLSIRGGGNTGSGGSNSINGGGSVSGAGRMSCGGSLTGMASISRGGSVVGGGSISGGSPTAASVEGSSCLQGLFAGPTNDPFPCLVGAAVTDLHAAVVPGGGALAARFWPEDTSPEALRLLLLEAEACGNAAAASAAAMQAQAAAIEGEAQAQAALLAGCTPAAALLRGCEDGSSLLQHPMRLSANAAAAAAHTGISAISCAEQQPPVNPEALAFSALVLEKLTRAAAAGGPNGTGAPWLGR